MRCAVETDAVVFALIVEVHNFIVDFLRLFTYWASVVDLARFMPHFAALALSLVKRTLSLPRICLSRPLHVRISRSSFWGVAGWVGWGLWVETSTLHGRTFCFEGTHIRGDASCAPST